MEDKLLKLLYDDRVISEQQYQQVLEECQRSSVSADAALEKLDILDEEQLLTFLSEKFRMPVINWDAYQPDPELLDIIPEHIASKYTIFPYALERGKRQHKITLAIANPSNVAAIDDLSFMTGSIIKTEVASTQAILNAIRTYYAHTGTPVGVAKNQNHQAQSLAVQHVTPCGILEFDTLLPDLVSSIDVEEEDDALAGLDRDHPSTKILLELLDLAVTRGFSEIHIEPYEQDQRVRFGRHGILHQHTIIPDQIGRGIIQRLRRIPQRPEFSAPKKEQPAAWKGHFTTTALQGKMLTILFSLYPGMRGEKMFLKIVNGTLPSDMTALGMDATASKVLERLLSKPQGLLLLVSPPKQGRTTTLYTILQQFAPVGKIAISVEQTVETVLPKITQIPLLSTLSFQEWYTFLSYYDPELLALEGLKTPLLEHLAVEFASSSLVLASFMASDFSDGLCTFLTQFCETCTKYSEKKLLLLLDVLSGILSQRLIRTICPHCKEKTSLSTSDQEFLQWFTTIHGGGAELPTAYIGKGCPECMDTGYAGQTGVFEVMKLDKGLKQFLLQSQPLSSFQVRDFLSEMSVDTMKYQAFQKMQQGISSVAEIRRVFFS